MVPGDPNDPYREFNAEADASIADQQMPRFVDIEIQRNAHHREKRRLNEILNRVDENDW